MDSPVSITRDIQRKRKNTKEKKNTKNIRNAGGRGQRERGS